MRTLYQNTPDTLADGKPDHVLAELRSGRYFRDPTLRYTIGLCGLTMDTMRTMRGILLQPEMRMVNILPVPGYGVFLP